MTNKYTKCYSKLRCCFLTTSTIAMNPDALPAKVNVLFNIFKRHKENIMVNRKRIGLQTNVHERSFEGF